MCGQVADGPDPPILVQGFHGIGKPPPCTLLLYLWTHWHLAKASSIPFTFSETVWWQPSFEIRSPRRKIYLWDPFLIRTAWANMEQSREDHADVYFSCSQPLNSGKELGGSVSFPANHSLIEVRSQPVAIPCRIFISLTASFSVVLSCLWWLIWDVYIIWCRSHTFCCWELIGFINCKLYLALSLNKEERTAHMQQLYLP